MSYTCPVDTCTWGKGGERYTTNVESALASHVQKRHPEELRPLTTPPPFTPIVGAKRAVIYLRVSTIDQHPENQLPTCRTFCGIRGWEVVGVYEDKASGKDTNRPELKRLLADSVGGHPPPFDVVVFRRMSRLGRSLRDNIALFDHFQALGVALVSVEEPYDTTTPSGRLIRNVLASVHEYERENLIEQIHEGNARRRAEGKPMGRHRAGCGVPVELGGLGPCPDGVQHKGFDLSTLSQLQQKRKAAAERKRKSRAAKRDNVGAKAGGPYRRDIGSPQGA